MLNTSSSSYRPILQPVRTNSTNNSTNSVQADATTPSTSASTPAATQTSGSNILRAMALASTTPVLTNAQAIAILKKPPFAPGDVNLINPIVYPASKTMPPAAATKIMTSTDIQAQLTKIFNKRFNGDATQIKAGMAVFNDPTLTKLIPDVRLRGSLTSLYGTPGQGAIDTIKSGIYSKVSFVDLPSSYIANVVTPQGATKPQMQFNLRYQNEDIRSLASTMAHEPLHQDLNISVAEERTAHSLDAMIYGKFVLEDPSLASKPTELTQRLNTKLMARLNSRDANGNLRISTSQGNVYPGGQHSLANFGAAFSNVGLDSPGVTNGATSPGNAYLASFLKGVTGVSVAKPNFDTNTDAIIDQHQTLFTPVQLVNLMQALKLKIT